MIKNSSIYYFTVIVMIGCKSNTNTVDYFEQFDVDFNAEGDDFLVSFSSLKLRLVYFLKSGFAESYSALAENTKVKATAFPLFSFMLFAQTAFGSLHETKK